MWELIHLQKQEASKSYNVLGILPSGKIWADNREHKIKRKALNLVNLWEKLPLGYTTSKTKKTWAAVEGWNVKLINQSVTIVSQLICHRRRCRYGGKWVLRRSQMLVFTDISMYPRTFDNRLLSCWWKHLFLSECFEKCLKCGIKKQPWVQHFVNSLTGENPQNRTICSRRSGQCISSRLS